MMGDFNEGLPVDERLNASEVSIGILEFSSLIQDLELVDLPLANQRYIWARTNAASRIDRVLVTREWITNFPGLKTICADRSLSDHWPVILQSHREESRGPYPFRALNS